MTFASVQELLQGTRQAIELNGGVRVKDPTALRGETIDRLVHTAVFGDADVRDAARWLIWELGWAVGVRSASIDSLYQARARQEYSNPTVPAINVRAMAYDFARAIVASARRRNVGAFIFELARSEMGYTDQSCDEFATVMMAAAIKEGHRGPIFIQGDHYQANAKKDQDDPEAEIEGLRKLAREAIAAGYGNIDIDTSTLVDLAFPTLDEQPYGPYSCRRHCPRRSAAAPAPSPLPAAARAALARARAIAQALSKYTGEVSLSGKPWVVEMPNPRGAPVPITLTATRNEDAIIFTATFNANQGPMTLSESMYPVRKAPAPSSTTLPGLQPDPASTP